MDDSTLRRARAMPAVGDIIDGRYELVRDLGSGGSGAVFEARHVYTRRVVAVKLITEGVDLATTVELRARLLREAHALAAVRNPGVVDVHDAGIAANGLPYLVLERLEGETIEAVLATRGRLSVAETVALGVELACTLAVVHASGVVHRDVKPSNIFIVRDASGEQHTKLVDFGVARMATPEASGAARASGGRKLTMTGASLGTPEYMSPEQLHAREVVDGRSDVYALGVTLYECLAGEVPFVGTHAEVLLQCASSAPIPNLRERAADVPEAVAEVIHRALAKDKADRFPDMASFALALAAAVPDARRSRRHLRLGARARQESGEQPVFAGEAVVEDAHEARLLHHGR